MVENEVPGYDALLSNIPHTHNVPVIGITGPPGAGKSTIVNALISYFTAQGKKLGIIAVDPTSPFNFGALLGDRIRMAEHYNNPNVFIRSLASRGSLGGLSAKTIEVVDIMKAAGFDYVLIETVGVGQSEVEIAGLADTTIVVLVPEAGDEIQGLKSGIMEIADIFVVNKSDRPGAQEFLNNLKRLIHQRKAQEWHIPVVPTVASKKEGVAELANAIENHLSTDPHNKRKSLLLAEKAYQLILRHRMNDINKKEMAEEINSQLKEGSAFNLYTYVKKFLD